MSDAIIGIEKCGCITYANARPNDLDRESEKAITQIIRSGGQIRRLSVEEARQLPDFLPRECPHDPKGWEYEKPKEKPRIIYKRSHRGVSRVKVRVPHWPDGFYAGEVRRYEGAWWATEGWFNTGSRGAHYGDDPCDELGPFGRQREAAEALIPFAEEKSGELHAEIEASRKRTAA